ncbi:MAG: RagB/SusD family nutrient uptake outer membrane protein [Phycisphaerae bacterium]|nr:RagB/SusD family nutrient uptake outer membrane protein [Saprospiraceae bacterium]
MRNIKILTITVLLLGAVSCFKDLDTVPLDPDILSADAVYKQPGAYRQVLAKLYAGLALSGQEGPAGQNDISGIDEGFGQYLRGFWYHEELSTDEAVVGWNDQTIKDFHAQSWADGDVFVYAFYSRLFVQIALTNEYIRETTDAKLDSRSTSAAMKAEVKRYRAEARFLRALSYWHALDNFRNVPFATEDDVVGAFVPKQKDPKELFQYIESELKAILPDLADSRANEYGRADKGAAWMLLAKLYLNAEVYIHEARYTDCLTYCEFILNAGYELEPTYANLFLADNHKSKEIIFPVAFDGLNTRTYGGTTFIIHASVGGSMIPEQSGISEPWAGTRTTQQLIEKFPSDLTGIKVDFNAGQTVLYPKLYVPGSHQGWDFTDLLNSLAATSTVAPNNKIYEGHKYFSSSNTRIFLTTIPAPTAPKYGDNGANGTLEISGDTIRIPQAGLHFFKVNLNTKTYTIEKRTWSIIGTATGGVDVNLSWDPANEKLVADAPLVVGTFKFRANQDDAINLGDNGTDALLELNGTEIQIAEPGNYKISLDVDKPDYTYQIKLTSFDHRGMFYTDGQNLEINDLTLFTEGYAVNKFKNITSDGMQGKDTYYPDTDFPMFRLADVYLMASECLLRIPGGDKNRAADLFNAVRTRAFTGSSGNFTVEQLDLPIILDERARELYWECHRRQDLVRFGQFTDGTYKWAWKGGVKDGAAVESYRNIYPIPSQDLGANPGLSQNPGY